MPNEDWDKLDAEWLRNQPSEPLPNERYRMPLGFGKQPGPRNFPPDQTAYLNHNSSDMFQITYLTDGEMLQQMLPPGIVYHGTNGDPEIRVWNLWWNYCYWIGGRPYASFSASVPVISRRSGTEKQGSYHLVSWHNCGDNVVSARDDIGWPTLPADYESMRPVPRGPQGWRMYAYSLGFRFLELEFDSLVEVPPRPAAMSDEENNGYSITFKYNPNGYEEGAAVSRVIELDQRAYHARGGAGHVEGRDALEEVFPTPRPRFEGNGTVRWNRATWEDMPSQYHVINRMASLPQLEVREASLTRMPTGLY